MASRGERTLCYLTFALLPFLYPRARSLPDRNPVRIERRVRRSHATRHSRGLDVGGALGNAGEVHFDRAVAEEGGEGGYAVAPAARQVTG